MKTLIKILVGTFFSIFAYDTINFFLQKPVIRNTQIDVKQKLEPDLFIQIPHEEEYDEDCIPGFLCFSAVVIVAVLTVYKIIPVKISQQNGSRLITAQNIIENKRRFNELLDSSGSNRTVLTNSITEEISLIESLEKQDQSFDVLDISQEEEEETIEEQSDDEGMMKFDKNEKHESFDTFNNTGDELKPSDIYKTNDITLSASCHSSQDTITNDSFTASENKTNVIIFSKDRYEGSVEYKTAPNQKDSPSNASMLLVSDSSFMQSTINEQSSTVKCSCNIEQFDERLEAVESNLRSTENITKEWGKRIEQAEMELINLHRHMYSILSNARFRPPSSEALGNEADLLNGKDFNACSSAFDIPSIIAETKKQLEEEDLFKNSIKNDGGLSNIDWKAKLKAEVKNEIEKVQKDIDSCKSQKEIFSVHDRSVNENSEAEHEELTIIDDLTSSSSCIGAKLKKELLNKQEELRAKTDGLVKEMEEVVKREPHLNSLQKISPRVPTHIVVPYKRTMYTETDRNLNQHKPMKSVPVPMNRGPGTDPDNRVVYNHLKKKKNEKK